MKPRNYKDIDDYEAIVINGIRGLITNCRISRESLPNGLKALSIREDDENLFGSLEEKVWVNHVADFLTSEISDVKGLCVDINDHYYLETEQDRALKHTLLNLI